MKEIRLGRPLGIPLSLHWSLLVLVATFTVVAAFSIGLEALVIPLWFALLYATVLLHELGHAIAARAFGIQPLRISLNAMGGCLTLERHDVLDRNWRPEFWITVAGPMVNLVALWMLLICEWVVGGGFLMNTLWRFNLLLLLFNLIPAWPMDGGRILHALLNKRFGYDRATKYACIVAYPMAAAIFAMAFFGYPLAPVISVFIVLTAVQQHRSLRAAG